MITHLDQSVCVDEPFEVEAEHVGKATYEVLLARVDPLTVMRVVIERFFLEESVEALFDCPGVARDCQVYTVEGLEASF